jgi:hypothetical protein
VIGFGFVPFIALLLFLWFGAMILRAAIGFANKRGGPSLEPNDTADDDDDWGDYPLPGKEERSPGAILMPGIGRGMWMLLVIVIVNVIVGAAIQMVMSSEPGPRHRGGLFDDADFLARLATIPASFLVTAGLLAAMLPTRFSRGCLVALFFYLICIGIAIGFAVPMFALRLVFRGG